MNPLAIKVLRSLDYPTDDLRSKSWEEFAARRAGDGFRLYGLRQRGRRGLPGMAGPADDGALGHRGPGRGRGHRFEKEAAFVAAFRYLKNRIAVFTSLPLQSIDRLSLGTRLRDIGQGEGATTLRPDVA